MKAYFANGLFSQADAEYNARVVKELRSAIPELTVYLPQENASINDKTAYADSKMIAQADTDELTSSQLMIAVLDGISIDAGVASEIGVAYAEHIPIVGLYTDTRQQGATNSRKLAALSTIAENQFHYMNLYTTGLIKLNGSIVNNTAAMITAVKQLVKKQEK